MPAPGSVVLAGLLTVELTGIGRLILQERNPRMCESAAFNGMAGANGCLHEGGRTKQIDCVCTVKARGNIVMRADVSENLSAKIFPKGPCRYMVYI